MRISTRGRYGLRAMLDLAMNPNCEPVRMSAVARRQALSRKYLHALLTTLKTAGLVRGVRGAGGGFVLARPPAEIKLSEILHALEGPLSLVDCVADERFCDRTNHCPARHVWLTLAGAINDVLERFTLADLVALENEGGAKESRNRGTSKNARIPTPARARRRKAGKK